MRRRPTFALAAPMESPSTDVLLCLWLTRLWRDQLPTLLNRSFSCILLVLSVAVALAFVSFQLGANSFPMSHFSTVETRFILLLWVSGLLHKCHDLGLGYHLGRGFVSSKLGWRGILRRHPFLLVQQINVATLHLICNLTVG
jgi:hypothetical protein